MGLPVEPLLPPATRLPVDLEAELATPWQAGGEIVLFPGPDGRPLAGRNPTPPVDAQEERARRLEHFALAYKLNLVTAPDTGPPIALPLTPEQVALLARFALSDAGAVWFREVADDTLRLFNKGYLAYDPVLWEKGRSAGQAVRLSDLITGGLSEAGLFAQDAALFRIFAHDGRGAMAANASIRLGREGLRCHFTLSDELVDPHAVLSHEFGHTRYGDARSAGTPLGEAATVAKYENPVRIRNGYPPRTVYDLRLDPRTPSSRATSCSTACWRSGARARCASSRWPRWNVFIASAWRPSRSSAIARRARPSRRSAACAGWPCVSWSRRATDRSASDLTSCTPAGNAAQNLLSQKNVRTEAA